MSGHEQINALVVAQRVLTKPSRFRVTDNEVMAMAGCLVGLDQQIDTLEARPSTNARLAAAIASFIQKEDALAAARAPDGYVPLPIVAARYEAFNALKTTFETEFPNV
jgi:hypothetical protein